MKQLYKIILLAVIAVSVAVPTTFLSAQESVDLGVQSTGLLPSNPFYFLKEWGRGFRKLLVPGVVRKAELELLVLNERAAELQKLEEITGGNSGAIAKAVLGYQEGLERLLENLKDLKETSENPNVDRLAENLISRGVRHFRLLEDLSAKLADGDELAVTIEIVLNKLAEALAIIPGQLDDSEKFQQRFQAVVKDWKDSFRELRGAEIADRLEDLLSGEARGGAAFLRENLLLQFSGRLEGSALGGEGFGDLSSVPGDKLRRLRMIDEVRENILNPELRNELNILRQKILMEADEAEAIGAEEANRVIEEAATLLKEAEEKVAARSSVKNSIKELIERAKFNIAQAEKFLAEENFGGAFGQATAAKASLKNVWNQLSPESLNAPAALERAQREYDELRSAIVAADVSKEENPKIFSLLTEAERRIVELAKLVERDAFSETISTSLRTVTVLLSTIEQFSHVLSEPRPEVIEPVMEPISAPVNEVRDLPAVRQTSVLQPEVAGVVITGKGFEPTTIKVTAGAKVVWTNQDIRPHWPASALHPTHNLLPGFDALQGLSEGESYSFVFEKAGVWKYHDHLNPGLVGVVEVVE
ncbi:MAG: hypothetical protein AAB389_02655 [Patescibacteria group bacterium]